MKLLQYLADNPGLRLLVHSAKDATEEQIALTALQLERMKQNEKNGTNRGYETKINNYLNKILP